MGFFPKVEIRIILHFQEIQSLCGETKWSSDFDLWSDGVGEYNSTKFINFYDEQGIKHEVTSCYAPQPNEVVERRNIG